MTLAQGLAPRCSLRLSATLLLTAPVSSSAAAAAAAAAAAKSLQYQVR